MVQLANHSIRSFTKKLIPLIFGALLMTSCAYKFTSKTYITVEPWKEWQVKLQFKDDSSFEMVDSFGCNTFDYVGNWRFKRTDGRNLLLLQGSAKVQYDSAHDAYLVPNSRTGKTELIKADRYFPIISLDTMIVLKKKVLQFRGLTFKAQSATKDLNLERAKMIERYYTHKFGKRQFIEAFGGGKGLAEARKAILECGKVPIPLKLKNPLSD